MQTEANFIIGVIMGLLGTRLRCLLVWSAASTSAVLGTRLLWPGTASVLDRTVTATGPGAGPTFEQLLVALCGTALLACVTWAWLVTTVVVVEAWRGAGLARPSSGSPTGVPAWARRLVLAACGAALVATASPAGASPATRSDGPVATDPAPRAADLDLDGLPYPDRPSGTDRPAVPRPPVSAPPGGPAAGAAPYVVRPGDSLWTITERTLAGRAPVVAALPVDEVACAVRATYDRNRAVVGDDPDLILPGQQLRLPPT